MIRFLLCFVVVVLASGSTLFAQKYLEMMHDLHVNFYDVVREADAYFATHDKGKGSGYTPYLRWKHENESRYYPSGVRNAVPADFSQQAWEEYRRDEMAKQKGNSLQGFPNGWVELGPRFINNITGHYSPGLGRVENFYVSPRDANRVYLGSRSGGFWRSTNGGTTWENTTDKLAATGVNAIAVSPTNHDSVLINVRNASNGTTHGIYRSTDGGLTWKLTQFNPKVLGKGGLGSNFGINQIAYSPVVSNLILITANDGVYRSTDNLETWERVFTSGASELEFHPTNANYVYVYSGSNRNVVLRSLNQGKTFSPSAVVPNNNDATNVRLAVSKNCPNCLFFASPNGVWKSTDFGANFTFVAKPPQSTDGYAVSDTDINIMVTGAIDTWVSTNGGANFTQRTWWSLGSTPFTGNSYVHADLRDAKCVNGVFYVATDGYLCKSTDNGTTWKRMSEGTGIRENYSLGIAQSNTYRNYLGSQDNGESVLTENGWLEFYGADGMEGVFHTLNHDWFIGSVQNGSRRRSKDGGKTGQGVTPPGQKNAAWIAPLFTDPNNPMRVWSVSDTVYRSDNFGSTWTRLGYTGIGTANEGAIAENNTDIIYLSTGSKLSKSTDGGATFTVLSGLPNKTITDIALSPRNDNIVVVTYNNYQRDTSKVFITTNGGNSWMNISFNLRDLPITSVVLDHSPEQYIYLGTEHGVVYKRLADSEWRTFNPNLPNVSIQDIKIHNGSNTLRIATWGRGLWEYALAGRADFPAINRVWISDPPTDNTPKQGSNQNVTAHVVYAKELSRVYLKWSANAPTFTGGEIELRKVNDTTYTSVTPLPLVATGTKLYFKVFAQGQGTELSESYKYMYTVQPFKYCDAIGADNTTSDYITSVRLNGKEYTSGKDKYGNFLNKTFELYTDSTYTLGIGMQMHWDEDTTAAWIDFNHNAVFEEDEMIVMSELNAQHASTGEFTVPTDVGADTTRMRVRSQYYNESPTPCGTNTGEVEDYTIIFKRAPKLSYTTSTTSLCKAGAVLLSYTGDAVDSLQWKLTSGTATQTAKGASATFTLSNAGTYTLTLTAYKGTATFVSTNTNAFTLQPLNKTINTTTNQLRSNQTGATYQWIDCANNNQPIAGATSQVFSPTASGLFAVIISKDECTDTSVCTALTVVSVEDFTAQRPTCTPNPTQGIITITIPQQIHSATICIYDIHGRKVQTLQSTQQRNTTDLSSMPQGVYFIEIRTATQTWYYTITKNE